MVGGRNSCVTGERMGEMCLRNIRFYGKKGRQSTCGPPESSDTTDLWTAKKLCVRPPVKQNVL